MSDDRYTLVIAPSARRQLAEQLPESVAFAAYEFILGPLLDNPRRVGKQLRPPLDDRHSARRGTYRVMAVPAWLMLQGRSGARPPTLDELPRSAERGGSGVTHRPASNRCRRDRVVRRS